jgi:Zn-dependent protease with chaperone function
VRKTLTTVLALCLALAAGGLIVGCSLIGLFNTHPPIEERIARLRAMRLTP